MRSSTTAFAFWRNRTPTACTSSHARATISPSASHKPLRRSQPCRRARALLTAKRSPATRMASRSSEMIRWRRHDKDVVLCAFDLLKLNGQDLRKAPIEERKRTLAKLLRRSPAGITFNEHYEGDGTTLFQHACQLGCEGIVSKRLGSSYRSGRVDDWLKNQELRWRPQPSAKRIGANETPGVGP